MTDVTSFPDQSTDARQDGIALALSGGGYRAMVFHVGALLRLNEVGLLGKLARVSSVSGGSITAGVLALSWGELRFRNGIAANMDILVQRIRLMASTTIDMGAIIGGILLPGTVSDRVAAAYDRVVFKGKKLSDLADEAPGVPRFVFNATNIQTAALWRFSKPYMGDYRVGLVRNPDVPLAVAVAASSAFPPVLSPVTLEIKQPVAKTDGADLSRAPYTKTAVLSDGGVYDNLGLETVAKRYKTLLVSDAGQKIAPGGGAAPRLGAACDEDTGHGRQPGPEPQEAEPDRTRTFPAKARVATGASGPISRTTSSPTIRWDAPAAIPTISPRFPPGWKQWTAPCRTS